MTYPPDDHRPSIGRRPIEQDDRIVNGSMLALAAFLIVAIGIAWYALSNHRSDTASVKAPAFERSAPDSTTGYGNTRAKAPAPKNGPQ